MKPVAFGYLRASSAQEAQDLLAAYPDAKVLAGGQSLMPLLNLRLTRPAWLIDINACADLDYIEVGRDGVRVGALTRHQRLAQDPALRQANPLLAEAAAWIGHPAIRNRGTIGGSLAHADPSAEWVTVATALQATVEVTSRRGRRVLPVADFIRGYLTTALEADELVTAVHFPRLAPGSGTAFVEVARRHGDFALVAVACAVRTDSAGRLAEVWLAVGGAAPQPVVPQAALERLRGARVTAELLEATAEDAAQAVDPASDLHASADYRRHLARVLTRQALSRAWAGSGGVAL